MIIKISKLISAYFAVICFSLPVFTLQSPLFSQSNNNVPAPKLVLFICVDQFRYENLTRYESYFGNGGFRRLLDKGAVFTDCRYEHATLYTAVGHATMSTGTYPFVHGIISNDWYERTAGKIVYAVEDSIGTEPGSEVKKSRYGRSPQYLMGSTIGDELKMHTGGKGKVYSISNKDRAAILMAGRMADGVYWMDIADGRWVSTRHYMETYPAWVSAFNKSKPLDKWFGKSWPLLKDTSLYPAIDPDLLNYYDVQHNMGSVFPHLIGAGKKPDKSYYQALRTSPYGVEAINDFVRVLLTKETLGQDTVTDLLCLSYSPGDYIGHEYGPFSRETMDYILRLDVYLDSLFWMVDRAVGLDQTLIVLTSDHGIAPIPRMVGKKGFPLSHVDRDSIKARINTLMVSRYGAPGKASGYVIAEEPNFYFDPAILKEKNIDKIEAENYIKKVIIEEQWKGIFRVYTFHEMLYGNVPDDDISRQVLRSFHPARTGDLFFLLNPFQIWFYKGKGSEHGQWYAYDTHVPMLWAGENWIRSGRYYGKTSPADIAPTLSTILKTGFPSGTVGKVIVPCLK